MSDRELLELIFGLIHAFRPERALVLLFHLERTVGAGAETHQATEDEVMQGFYDHSANRWIRGRAGVSVNTWRQINAELEAEGLLQTTKSADGPTRYTPQWDTVHHVIATWQERLSPSRHQPGPRLMEGRENSK